MRSVDVWPDLLTVEEAAEVLRIGRTKAYDLAKEWRATDGASGLPVVDLGNVLRVSRRALEDIVGGPPPPTGQPQRAIAGCRRHRHRRLLRHRTNSPSPTSNPSPSLRRAARPVRHSDPELTVPTAGLPNSNNEVADTCHPCGVAARVVPRDVPAEVPTGGRA